MDLRDGRGGQGALGVHRHAPPAMAPQMALPKSEPDLSLLEGLSFGGLPIRLRQVFLARAFAAGLHQGREVASFKDIELRLAPGPGR